MNGVPRPLGEVGLTRKLRGYECLVLSGQWIEFSIFVPTASDGDQFPISPSHFHVGITSEPASGSVPGRRESGQGEGKDVFSGF